MGINCLSMLQASVGAILDRPHARAWSLQGFGMLRTYFDEARKVRLHVWDPRYAEPGVSTIHDHPWGFESIIVAGRVRNQRYMVAGDEITHKYRRIKCGSGGGLLDEPDGLASLQPLPIELYGEGDSYGQRADEIHESLPEDGSVTLVRRVFLNDTEHARVFWPFNDQWVSAEPRPASQREVDDICRRALARWF